ncbi:MAG: hypothetical protein J5J00_11760 [Deltaproteobacteria bacterium]|nr:hypothetical protein [Deltaproteobacteria bacterium]
MEEKQRNGGYIERARDKARSVRQNVVGAGRRMKQRASQTYTDSVGGVGSHERGEGSLTKATEYFTSSIPSGTFLTLAITTLGTAAALRYFGQHRDASLVAQMVPAILILGLYNKLVKLEGSE